MAATAFARRSPRDREIHPDLAIAALVIFAALLLRWPHFGDPAFMIDEQFYLLAGDRLLHGAIPYVDIWDRKPIGLFLIYAATRLFGGDGFWQYQLVATAFAAGTAFLIYRIARLATSRTAALGGALLYLLWIELAEGGGGQAPVFYNLFMAGAALSVLKAAAPMEDRRFGRLCFVAMALTGLAIQVKYTAVFEGFCFGLILSFWSWKRLPPGPATIRILLLAATALAPTLAAFAVYATIGQAPAFWFANFVSIFNRGPTPHVEMIYRTEMAMLRLMPFLICIIAGAVATIAQRDAAVRRWQAVMLAWCVASLIGLFAIGTLYSHYILPVFVPFSAFAAPAFSRRLTGPALALFTALLPASALHWPDFARTVRHQEEVARLTALIPPRVDRGCMQIFDGPPILAYTTHACALSRFVFPDHLSAALEENGIGTDPVAELRQLLARRPLAITIGESDVRPPNEATFAVMHAALARDYRLAGRAPFDGRYIDVYIRR
jgi:4-amino-4-deoxy-L-arabinose transferase-like glycosyltransferase